MEEENINQSNPQLKKQSPKKKSKYFAIIALVLFIFSLASLALNFSIGGCQYADLSFNFKEVVPSNIEVESDGCSSIDIDGRSGVMMSGDYDLEITGSVDSESFRPLTPLSKTEFTLKVPESGDNQTIIKGSTRYNLLGLFKNSFYYFAVLFIISFFTATVFRKKEARVNKSIKNGHTN